MIEKVYKSMGQGGLKPAKDELGEDFAYDEIRLVRAKLEREDGVVFF